MKHKLPDGRWLMASYDDIYAFFEENKIAGKTIKDVIPFEVDYYINNMEDIEDILSLSNQSGISTDGQICLLFADDSSLEVEFSGDGPILLGYNSAKLSEYPEYDGSCYKLNTLFRHCIGRTIVGIEFQKTMDPMIFPSYMEIDMSEDDDGIKWLKFLLDDESYLLAEGNLDWFDFSHMDTFHKEKMVPFKDLIAELDLKYFPELRDVLQGKVENKR